LCLCGIVDEFFMLVVNGFLILCIFVCVRWWILVVN